MKKWFLIYIIFIMISVIVGGYIVAAKKIKDISDKPPSSSVRTKPENYVFFNLNREGIKRAAFYNCKQFVGAQIKYTWKDMEKARDTYDFSAIEADLKFLSSKGKKLFIQIQDVSFDPSIINVPDYIVHDPEFRGGVNLQYEFSDESDSNAKKAGWVARRWDPAVADRFHRLLNELGKHFDKRIAGITLPETAVDFGSTGKYYPPGFSTEKYRDAIIGNMKAAGFSFRKAVVIQYANFMPGEWLPWDDKGYLSSVFEYAKTNHIGVGGPDLIPYRKGQMNQSYHFAVKYQGLLPLGYAVQEGNYTQLNAQTGKKLTVPEIYDFAANYLKADYIFWYPQEPYFTHDVIPFLRKLK